MILAFRSTWVVALGFTTATLCGSGVLAATSDFVCRPADNARAIYLKTQLRNCGSSKVDEKSGICQLDGKCAYVHAEAREDILKEYRGKNPKVHTYDGIPPADKERLLKSRMSSLNFHPAVLTCQGRVVEGTAGGPMCPTADKCKADAMIEPETAMIDPSGSLDSALNTTPVVPGTDGAPSAGAKP